METIPGSKIRRNINKKIDFQENSTNIGRKMTTLEQEKCKNKKIEPKRAQRDPKRSQKGANEEPKGAKRVPKGAKRESKGAKRVPKGAKREPKSSQRAPKGSQKATQIHPKIDIRERSQKRSQNCANT